MATVYKVFDTRLEREVALKVIRREIFSSTEMEMLVTIVAPEAADVVLDVMRNHQYGQDAAIIGAVTQEHPKRVVARTAIGGSRVVDLPAGELLPRIC